MRSVVVRYKQETLLAVQVVVVDVVLLKALLYHVAFRAELSADVAPWCLLAVPSRLSPFFLRHLLASLDL